MLEGMILEIILECTPYIKWLIKAFIYVNATAFVLGVMCLLVGGIVGTAEIG